MGAQESENSRSPQPSVYRHPLDTSQLRPRTAMASEALLRFGMYGRTASRHVHHRLRPSMPACRHLSGSMQRFASKHMTDAQIAEVGKHDAVLAEQIRTARDRGLAIGWKDLEDIPVHHIPHQWPASGGPPQAAALGGK